MRTTSYGCSRGGKRSQKPKERSYRNAHAERHQVVRYRPAWPTPLRGHDLLLEHRSPTRPQHPLRGLGPLRHNRLLRAQAPVPYPTWHHLRDLRHDRPRSLPNQESGWTHGVVGYAHHRARLLAVLDLGWSLYLLRTL